MRKTMAKSILLRTHNTSQGANEIFDKPEKYVVLQVNEYGKDLDWLMVEYVKTEDFEEVEFKKSFIHHYYRPGEWEYR